MLDDASLLAGLRRRDPKVQAQAWRHFFPRIRAACAQVLGDAALGEEVAQDVWIDFAYTHVDRVQHPRAVYAYLRLMAVRRARRVAQRRARLAPESDAPHPAGLGEGAVLEALDAPTRRARLARCLDTLTPRARQMLRLRFYGEQSVRAIGEAFGVSKQAASKAIRKSLGLLLVCLEGADGR